MSKPAVVTCEGVEAGTASDFSPEPLAMRLPRSQSASSRADELNDARSKADELAREVAQLQRCAQESAECILRLKTALRTLLADFERCAKAEVPLAGALRDLPTVLREAYAALEG